MKVYDQQYVTALLHFFSVFGGLNLCFVLLFFYGFLSKRKNPWIIGFGFAGLVNLLTVASLVVRIFK